MCPCETVYVVTDGKTVTLPPATTSGQMIILMDVTTSAGITIDRAGSDTIFSNGGSANLTSLGPSASFMIISDGNHHWVSMTQ